MRFPSVGVIGAGARGMRLGHICDRYGALQAVADILPERLRRVRAQFPKVRALPDPRALFRTDVEAIAIASPVHTRVGLALEAIAHGKHVFIDKPLAMSEEGAVAVAIKAQREGCSVFVGHDLLYHPAIVAQRALAQSGELGDVVHVRARRFAPGVVRTDEDVWRLAPDDMAYIVALFGEPTSVAASLQSRAQGALADFVYADIQFGGERSAHIEVTRLDPHDGSRVDVFGTLGVASVQTATSKPQLSLHHYRRSQPVRNAATVIFDAPAIRNFPSADPLESAVREFLGSFIESRAKMMAASSAVPTS